MTTKSLLERLEIKASMIQMGEIIAWGSDSALMREAAAHIEAQAAALVMAREALIALLSQGTERDIETGIGMMTAQTEAVSIASEALAAINKLTTGE